VDKVVALGRGNKIELYRVVHASVSLPVDMPTFISSIFEGLPLAPEASKPEVVVDRLSTSGQRVNITKRPLVCSAIITFRASIGLRLERLAQGSRQVYDLQTDCAGGVVGERGKVGCPGEVIADIVSLQGVLVVIFAKANRQKLKRRCFEIYSKTLES
jgi:hypothetical protein